MAFVGVEQVEEGLDVMAVGDAVFFFALGEALTGVVAPAAFAQVAVPDFNFFLGRFATVGETPFEDVLVLASQLHASDDIFVFHTQEGTATAIESATKGLVVVDGQFALGVEANFVEHTAKVDEAADFFMRGAKAGDFHGWIVACIAVTCN